MQTSLLQGQVEEMFLLLVDNQLVAKLTQDALDKRYLHELKTQGRFRMMRNSHSLEQGWS